MEIQREVINLLFDLTFTISDYIRCNRHGKHGPRIRDVMLFKTIYQAENHQIKMSELASILGVSPAAVSQLIATFEKNGLLRRVHSNTDRRSVYIQIVPEAVEEFQKKMDIHTNKVHEYLDYLGNENCEHLKEILIKTKQFMEEDQ